MRKHSGIIHYFSLKELFILFLVPTAIILIEKLAWSVFKDSPSNVLFSGIIGGVLLGAGFYIVARLMPKFGAIMIFALWYGILGIVLLAGRGSAQALLTAVVGVAGFMIMILIPAFLAELVLYFSQRHPAGIWGACLLWLTTGFVLESAFMFAALVLLGSGVSGIMAFVLQGSLFPYLGGGVFGLMLGSSASRRISED